MKTKQLSDLIFSPAPDAAGLAVPIRFSGAKPVRVLFCEFVAVLAVGLGFILSAAGVQLEPMPRLANSFQVVGVHAPNIRAFVVGFESVGYWPDIKLVGESVGFDPAPIDNHQAIRVAATVVGGGPLPTQSIIATVEQGDLMKKAVDWVTVIVSFHPPILTTSTSCASA